MEPPPSEQRPSPPPIGAFLGEPTRELADWRWLWATDQSFPIQGRPGLAGRLAVAFRRLIRPFVKLPLNDLFDRQRTFNCILLEHLERERQRGGELERSFAHLRQRLLEHVEALAGTVERLEAYRVEGLDDLLKHNDALFALLDQKLDRYRRETQQVWGRLGAALARAEEGTPQGLARVHAEQSYVELERRFRGTEEDIAGRIARYLPYLEGRGEVLDLGCGRGEALALLHRHGIVGRGVDASAEMVATCREKGLAAIEADLFAALAETAPASLGAVVSFHVIEHLPPESLDRLVRLAWGALRPGGVLILETPSPLSLVVAARNFWLDPTHRRPVHPASLELACRMAGFEPVERLDLRPFADSERLPDIEVDAGPPEVRALAAHAAALRDRLDRLLFGFQDYAIVAFKA